MKLEIKDLHVSINDKEILKGINLVIESGKVHALMGPNGSGKSTLAQIIMGYPKYVITKGKILLNGEDITELKPDERAKKGLFLSFQYPKEITGVTLTNFLRAAYNATHEPKLSVLDFHKMLKEKMEKLNIDASFTRRYVNEGFSGGEKKKAEILQMMVLNPKFAILDEPDSGTDVDALKELSEAINIAKKETSIVIITHYNKILKYVKPDVVMIIVNGKVVDKGNAQLASDIETFGYKKYLNIEV